MKNSRGILDLKHKKSLRLGLLLVSTLLIIGASALVYARMIYEKALDVGNTGAVTTGSGSTGSAGAVFTPTAIVMLVVAALIVGLSMFGFLRKTSKHISDPLGGGGSSPASPLSVSLEVPGISLPSDLPSMQGEEWEESPAKEEGEE
jgi:hypothetical protein